MFLGPVICQHDLAECDLHNAQHAVPAAYATGDASYPMSCAVPILSTHVDCVVQAESRARQKHHAEAEFGA